MCPPTGHSPRDGQLCDSRYDDCTGTHAGGTAGAQTGMTSTGHGAGPRSGCSGYTCTVATTGKSPARDTAPGLKAPAQTAPPAQGPDPAVSDDARETTAHQNARNGPPDARQALSDAILHACWASGSAEGVMGGCNEAAYAATGVWPSSEAFHAFDGNTLLVGSFVVGGLAAAELATAAIARVLTSAAPEAAVALRDQVTAAGQPVVESGGAPPPLPYSYAQTTANWLFGPEGKFGGLSIGDVASELKAGTRSVADVKVEVVRFGDQELVVNTRSALALESAGVPRSAWTVIDETSELLPMVVARLDTNKLTDAGTQVVKIRLPWPKP